MVKNCCIKNCLSNRKNRNNKVSLHLFPTNKPRVLRKWIEFVGYGDGWKPAKYAALCSLHFTPPDFRLNTNLSCLKPDAFPTVKNGINNSKRYRTQDTVDEINSDTHLKKTCRLCGNEYSTTIKDIFEVDDSYASLIHEHLQIQVTREDCFPLSVCVICENKLYQFVEFFNCVNKVQELFKQKLKKIESSEQFIDEDKHKIETKCKIISDAPCNENSKIVHSEPCSGSGHCNNNEPNIISKLDSNLKQVNLNNSVLKQVNVNNLEVISVDTDGVIDNNNQTDVNNKHTFEEYKKINNLETKCNSSEQNNQINVDGNSTFKQSCKTNDSGKNEAHNNNQTNINKSSIINATPITGVMPYLPYLVTIPYLPTMPYIPYHAIPNNNNTPETQFLLCNSDIKTMPKFADHCSDNKNSVSYGNIAQSSNNIGIPIKKEMETPNNDTCQESSVIKTNQQNLGKKIEILQDIKIEPNKMDFNTFRVFHDDSLNNPNKISNTIKHEESVSQPKKIKKKPVKSSKVMCEKTCYHCGSRFISKYALNNHMKFICEKRPNFIPKRETCNICNKYVLSSTKPNIKKCQCSKKLFSKNVSDSKKIFNIYNFSKK